MKKTILLGVTSGIAAFKSIDLVKKFRSEGAAVFVIMTKHAARMADPMEFEVASGNKVYCELFEKDFDYKKILQVRKVDHIELADNADVFVIAPATANVIAKLANGIADDFLTTTALGVTAPIIICPSMNVNMWSNPIVQANVEKLRGAGFHIIDPARGMLACGYEGIGRLADNDEIVSKVLHLLTVAQSMHERKVIVTAGGTLEKIDDVRYISNRSSGKMGAAIADECYLRGADVLLIRSKNSVKPRYQMKELLFTSADDLLELLQAHVQTYDYIYHVAAVSDFKVEDNKTGKLSSKKSVSITLEPNVKILDQIKKLNPKIRLIGFKAEFMPDPAKLAQVALVRLRKSGADAVVANDISKSDRAFESDMNEVYVLLADGSGLRIPLSFKTEIADKLVTYINQKLSV